MIEKPRLLIITSSLPDGGSIAGGVLEAIKKQQLAVEAVSLISSRPDSGAIKRARGLDFPEDRIKVLDKDILKSPTALNQALFHEAEKSRATHVILAGALFQIPDEFVQKYEGRFANSHPGRIDPNKRDENGNRLDTGGVGFYGMRPVIAEIARSNASRRDYRTEAVVMHVIPGEIDGGDVIAKATVNYSWIDSKGATFEEMKGKRRKTFLDDIRAVHGDMKSREPILMVSALRAIEEGREFPRMQPTQLNTDGLEHIIFDARAFALEFPALKAA